MICIMILYIVVIPLLVALEHEIRSTSCLHEGAHRILRAQLGGRFGAALAPVVAALEGVEPSLTVPLAAYHALDQLRDRA